MVHFRTIFITGLMLVLCSGLGLAQDKRFEIIIDLGYTASNGVNTNTDIGGGQIVDRITPKSGFSYGGTFNVFLSEAISVGFNFAQQNSKLEGRIVGGSKEEFADMTVANYHGIFTFHLAEEDSPMRPFFLVGLAARGRSTFSELRWYPPMEAAKGSLSWVFRAKQPESVRTGP